MNEKKYEEQVREMEEAKLRDRAEIRRIRERTGELPTYWKDPATGEERMNEAARQYEALCPEFTAWVKAFDEAKALGLEDPFAEAAAASREVRALEAAFAEEVE